MTQHDQSARKLAEKHVNPSMCSPVGYKHMVEACTADITEALRAAHDAGVKQGLEKGAQKPIMIFTDD